MVHDLRQEALEARARQSLGSSHDAIYRLVANALAQRGVVNARFIDVGCGGGALHRYVGARAKSYCGLDAVRYDGFPPHAQFIRVDLDAPQWPCPAGTADVVAAVETIEHLENPWLFVRQLAALAAPGGWVLVTTPNQLSALSFLTLIAKRRFSAFQDAHYPVHRTALLESDLLRAALAAGLAPDAVVYSHHGRLPLAAWHYPAALARMLPRALSDNVMLVARKPHV